MPCYAPPYHTLARHAFAHIGPPHFKSHARPFPCQGARLLAMHATVASFVGARVQIALEPIFQLLHWLHRRRYTSYPSHAFDVQVMQKILTRIAKFTGGAFLVWTWQG